MKFHSSKALLALSLLVAAPWVHAQDKGGVVPQARATDAPHTAGDMTELYYDDDNTKDCGDVGGQLQPAFMCSGIIIRGASPGATYNSWNPSPEDVKDGGVSFSYIRKDSIFKEIAVGQTSGFTLYPAMGKYNYKGTQSKRPLSVRNVLFPLDGVDSGSRCAHRMRPNLTTAWGAGWGGGPFLSNKVSPQRRRGLTISVNQHIVIRKLYQCAFDVISATIQYRRCIHANDWREGSRWAPLLLPTITNPRIKVWDPTWDKELPIQSFFYVGEANSLGWTKARTDQQAYFTKTKEFVPVIKITAPADQSGHFKFNFVLSDQLVTPPSSTR